MRGWKMARAAKKLTVVELEKELQRKRDLVEQALKRRDQLQRELNEVQREIHILQVGDPAKLPGRRKRQRNAQPLSRVVVELLTKNPTGFNLNDLADKVLETGYQTSSSNFRNVLYQCLYYSSRFYYDISTQTYRLSEEEKKP